MIEALISVTKSIWSRHAHHGNSSLRKNVRAIMTRKSERLEKTCAIYIASTLALRRADSEIHTYYGRIGDIYLQFN